ncbi:E3 ubiquitin-protein ligase TRIM71-like [Oculina patagonica]
MDIKTLLHNLHEEVSCSVCMTPFTNPKMLSCLHSFCLHCLKEIQRTSGRHDIIICPECRREIKITSGDLNDLPTNFRINSLLDVLAIKECNTTEAKCGNCDKKSPQCYYCFQCLSFWCDHCIVHHNGVRINRGHKLLALKDFQDEDFEDILKRPAFCRISGHGQKELEFYCKSCEVAICSSCVATSHDGHAKVLLEDAASKCKLQMKRFVESQNQKMQQKKNNIAKLDENCDKIKVQVASVKRNAQTFVDNITSVVEAKKEEIFNEVENQGKETLQCLGIQKNKVEQQLKSIKTSVGRTETVLKRNSSAELIQFSKSLHTLVQEEVDRGNQVDRDNGDLPEFAYVENEKVLNSLLNDGIGFVKSVSKKTVPCLSSAEGNGIRNATVGLKAGFVLTTRNAEGTQCHNECDKIALEIINSDGQDCMTEMQIENRKDGTYRISYFVTEAGKLNVSVKVNGDHIRGSPFAFQAKYREYKPVFSFGEEGSSAGMLSKPWGVAVNNRDEIAVTETGNDRVQVFRSDGTHLKCFGASGNGKGQFSFPGGIAFDQNNNILVADNSSHRVQIFTEEGKYLDEFGGEGSLNSHLNNPYGLCIDSDGNIIVADSGNQVVKILSSSKQFLQRIGGIEFLSSFFYCVRYMHYFVVSDFYENCVKVFDRDGTFQFKFGNFGRGDRQFNNPGYLAVDKAGHLMVCDEGNHRIQVFKLNGEFVARFGSKGSEKGEFNTPSSVAVLSDGRIVVSDYYNHRIQIFE